MVKRVKKVGGVFKILREKRLTTVAGSWVFFFLLSVVPLIFLMITAFGVFGVEISMSLVDSLPESLRLAGKTLVETATNASKGFTVFFIVTVVASITSLLNQMSKDGDCIYGAKSKKKRGIMRRVWALFALVIMFLVFLACALFFSFGNVLFKNSFVVGGPNIYITVLIFSLAIIFIYAIILLLNKFICPVKLRLSISVIGGLISLAVMVLGTIGFILYLKFFNAYNAFYGSLATVVVFLLWSYIIMLGLALGNIVNMQIFKKEKQGARN